MIIYNKLVRDNVAGLLKSKGYSISGKRVRGEQYNIKLYSLFLQEFKQTFDSGKKEMQLHYADMLEIIRIFMISHKMDAKKLADGKSQPINWYEKLSPSNEKISESRMDLLKKYDELLQVSNKEVVRDQLKDVFDSFKKVVEATGIKFQSLEAVRKSRLEKLGGFSKGLYIEGITKTNVVDYSV